jgi:hypothetical protein
VLGALAQLRHPRVVASTLVAAWRGALRTLSVTRGLVLSWTSDQTDADDAISDDGAESAKVRARRRRARQETGKTLLVVLSAPKRLGLSALSIDGGTQATEREDEGWKLWISTVGTGVGLGLLLALAQRPSKATSKSDADQPVDRTPRNLKAPAFKVPTMYQ